MAEPIKKPPVGLIPRNISEDRYAERRREEIRLAIDRYLMDGETPIPEEWIVEYNSIIARLKQ